MPAWWGEGPLLDYRLLTVSSHGEGARDLCGISFLGAQISVMQAPPHEGPPTPRNVITLGIIIPAFEFWEDTDFQATALYMISIMSYV